jgi:hypothetical protein
MLMLLFPEAKLTIEGFNKVSRSSPAKYQWTEGEVQSLENIRDGMQKYAPNLLAEYERFDELDQIGQEVFRQKIYALSIFNLTTWGLSGFRGESKFAGSAPLVFIKLFPKAKLERLGFRLDWTTPEQAGASVRYVLKQRRPDLVNWYARWDTLGERERESFRQTVYQLSYYEISSWGLGEALTRLGAGPDSESSYARVMQNIFDRAELNPLGFYLDWSTPKRGQDSVRYVLEKHVPDLMRAYGRWQELQPAEREAWRRQLYGINGSVLRLWGLSGAFDKNKPHGFKDGTFGVMQAVFPDAGLNALGFDLDWSTLARGIESVRYVLMREVPGLVQTYDRWDQLDPNARRALERKLAKIQTKDFLVWGLRGALRQGAPYFNGSYKQVLRMVFPKAYEQLQTPEVPAVPIAEKPAMSVLNAALSGGVYAGAAAFAGPWWLPALVAFVFGTQIALLIVIWKRYRASMSEPRCF